MNAEEERRELVSKFISSGDADPDHDDRVASISQGIIVGRSDGGGETGTEKISIQSFMAQLNPQLTSEDDNERFRATLLVSEILRMQPNISMTPATLHLIILCFCQKLSDSACIIPALDALSTLIVHHGQELGSKYSDASDILERLLKDVQVQAMIQVIRQRALDLTCILLEHMSKSSTFDKAFYGNVQVLEDLIALGDGEKDPRCLLLYLRLHKYVSHFSECMRESEALQRKVFYSFACYFPITFEPAPDDPYGMTKESLTSALEDVFVGTPALIKLVQSFLLEQIVTTSSPAAQSQGISVLVRLSKMYEPAIIFRDEGKSVIDNGEHDMEIAGKLAEQIHSVAMSSEDISGSALKELVTAVQEICEAMEAQVHSVRSKGSHGMLTSSSDVSLEQVLRYWRAFAGTLLNKSMVTLLENSGTLRGRIAGKVITAISRSGYMGLESVIYKVLPQALQKIKSVYGQALDALEGSQYIEMIALLRCSMEVARVIEEDVEEHDGIKLISCALNISDELQGFNALLHVEEVGEVLRTTIGECPNNATAKEKLRGGEVSFAVAQLLSFLLSIVPHEPTHALFESVSNSLSLVVKSRLSKANETSDADTGKTCRELLGRLSGTSKSKYSEIVQIVLHRAIECIEQDTGDRRSAADILTTIGSVSTDKDALRSCIKSLSSIVQEQNDDFGTIGITALHTIVSSCALGKSKAAELILKADGELDAIIDSAFHAKDTTALKTASSLLKIIIDNCDAGERSDWIKKLLDMAGTRLGLPESSSDTALSIEVDQLLGSLITGGRFAATHADSRLKGNVSTVLEENVIVESCAKTDTAKGATRVCLHMLKGTLESSDVDANQSISRCFATLVHNLTAGEELDRLLVLVLSLSSCDAPPQGNRNLVIELFVWTFRAVTSRPVTRPGAQSFLDLDKLVLGVNVASMNWEQIYTETLFHFLPGSRNEGSIGSLISRVQTITDDTVHILTLGKRSMLWRQRVWGKIYGKLYSSATGRAGSSQSTRCQALLLCGLAAGLPPAMLSSCSEEMTSLVQEAILYCSSDDNGPGSLNHHLSGDRVGMVLCLQSALMTMEKILQLNIMYAHSFVQFMAPLLIKICSTSKISRIRGLALNCLLSICLTVKGLAYEALRKQVIKGLRGTLNDRKRSIRKLATEVIDAINNVQL